jgi:hypothetical protein
MRFRIGTYAFQIPHSTAVKANVMIPPVDNFGDGGTGWELPFGKFSFFVHLEASGKPEDLGSFILSCTKQYVDLTSVQINGIAGVMYGTYDKQRTWIDWWMKKGELMICINLQGTGTASASEQALHAQVIESLTYVAA